MAVAFATGVVIGAAIALLSALAVTKFQLRRHRTALASALVGEIAAIVREIECRDVVEQLRRATDHLQVSLTCLPPRPYPVFEAEAGRLDRLAAPLPRKIAFFYTRMGALAEDVRSFADGELRGTEYLQPLLRELEATMSLSDEVLRDLREVASPSPLHLLGRA
ncbi:hypothetical protein ABEG18_00460 [Alsobacter sp. KACC 23698]|uniref:DUF2489 domain-containing protein n=1 Tax=Alsobacter sp. KACC 23698 TaxID=3149229 RepID=A0AAU7JG95_9HYPH